MSCSSSPTTSATATSDPYGGGELRRAPTPRIDQLAREGLRLTQYLSRAWLHTVARGADDRAILDPQRPVADHRARQPGYALEKSRDTMGELFKSAGYATAIFGMAPWRRTESLPTAHGFDEFYGIPPDISWDWRLTSTRL